MRYISIDLETTGLDPSTCQIIEFGAVLEDTNNVLPIDELPTFHAYVKPKNGHLSGNIFALNMNGGIIEKLKNEHTLKDQYNFVDIDNLAEDFMFWLHMQGFEIKSNYELKYIDGTTQRYTETLNVAGKNFSVFDKRFLDLVPKFNDLIRIRHRVLDPAMLYFDPIHDEMLPNLKTCKERAGIEGEVAHLAVSDCIDVIMLIRKHYGLAPSGREMKSVDH
jgi:oligoribonuclease